MEAVVRSMNIGEAQACARIACGSILGERYGFVETKLAENLNAAAQAGGELVVAVEEGRVTGFAWIEPHGAFATAPYLRLIAVDGAAQGRGIGAALLGEFERRTADVGRDYCLLVSDFNQNAIAFYARHGYRKAGELPDFARPGITEILMIKPCRRSAAILSTATE